MTVKVLYQTLMLFMQQMQGIVVIFGSLFILLGSIYLMKTTRRSKQAMASLQESENNFRLLVKTIPSVVFKGYPDWSVDLFDEKFEKSTGYSIEDFNSRRMKWNELIVPEDLERTKEIFRQALKTNKSYVREYRIKIKSGEVLWIRERGQIICDANGTVEYVTGI
jgi:PAS domain S-box-containing protein